jgi:hypothetical protein
MIADKRYTIKRDGWVTPLLVLFTATASRSWVELGDQGLRVRFGWHETNVPYAAITGGRRAHWPWYAGLGWRSNLRSILGLIGSYSGVVEITLDPRQQVRLLGIPFRVRELYFSLEEADQFLRDLEGHVIRRSEKLPAD